MASSSDEGEIIENGAEDLKATSLQHTGRSSVDRQDRHKSRHSTPDHDSASRQSNTSRRSNSPRGSKRPYDDREKERDRDYYGSRHDSGHYRSHYEDSRRDDNRRPRGLYDDLDRPASRASNYSYDGRDRSRERDHYRDKDRDWYANKRPRNRSRSPHRSRRADRGRFDRFVREGQYDRRDDASGELKYDDDRGSRNGGSVSKRTTAFQMEMAPPGVPLGKPWLSRNPNGSPNRSLSLTTRNLSPLTKRPRSSDDASGERRSWPSPARRLLFSFMPWVLRRTRPAHHLPHRLCPTRP